MDGTQFQQFMQTMHSRDETRRTQADAQQQQREQQHQQQLQQMMEQLAEASRRSDILVESLKASLTAPAEPQEKKGKQFSVKDVKSSIPSFSGKTEDWEDFAFKFRTAIAAADQSVAKLLQKAEDTKDELDEETDFDAEKEKISGIIYALLVGACDVGEALKCVKSIRFGQGVRAWQKLCTKFNPKTAARTIKLLANVVGPPKIANVQDVGNALDAWEEQVRKIEKIGGDFKLSDTMKVAIITSILPSTIQEFIYTNVELNDDFKSVMEKVRLLAGNKAEVMGMTPMDVGAVASPQCQPCDSQWDPWWQEEEVAAVNPFTRCYNCQGSGHLANTCPSPKTGQGKDGGKSFGKGYDSGKGKGKYDGGKGFGKDSGKGYGKWGNDYRAIKGSGKAIQGACWHCKQVGHRQDACPMLKSVQEIEPNAEQPVVIDGIETGWGVGIANIEFKKVNKKNASRRKYTRMDVIVEENFADANQWEALEEEEKKAVPLKANEDLKENDMFWQSCEELEAVKKRRELAEAHRALCKPGQKPAQRMEDVEIQAVEPGRRLTRESFMRFHEADCRKPLASAVKVAKAGNRVVLEDDGGYIENKSTGEKMSLRIENETYVYDVQLEDGSVVAVTMDSGAGCSVWPKGKPAGKSILEPRKPGMKMTAANGTDIGYYGQRTIRFRGIDASPFTRPR